jgi:general secretion pathway protein F
MSKTIYRLSVEQLAKLFTQLAQLESAGLPTFQALALMTQPELELKKPLALMQHYLTAGQPIAEAGFKAGIFDDTLKTLIHAAEASGQLASVYRRLANHYNHKNARIKKVKSRLYLPIFMLMIAIFVQPLPALINAEITGFRYLQFSLGQLLLIGLGMYLLISLPTIVHKLGFERAWHRLQLRFPLLANWISKRQINEFFFILSLMLESGLAFADALPKAVASIKNSILRDKFIPGLKLCSSGASVHETLSKVSIINNAMLHIIESSEQSGKLAGGISHFTKIEAETIGLQNDALAEWLPRLAYSLVAIWMAYSLLNSPITTVLPSNI